MELQASLSAGFNALLMLSVNVLVLSSDSKCELMKENRNGKSRSVLNLRPPEYLKMDNNALKEFRCDLLSFGESHAFQDILLPPYSRNLFTGWQ